jgi:hypothetical protein
MQHLRLSLGLQELQVRLVLAKSERRLYILNVSF